MAIERNAPCGCGSGLKYKRCCERKERTGISPTALALILIVILGAAAGIVSYMRAPDEIATPKRVWSEEHGHWHDVGAGGEGQGTPGPQPPGPAPAGKVWSEEHGHWHDAGPAAPGPPAPAPPLPIVPQPAPASPPPAPAD
jgi:hypothetical protein